VPGSAPGDPALVLIGPSRGVGQRLPLIEQRLDGRFRLGFQVPLGEPGRGARDRPRPG
jgi:hypothetical protein